MINPLNFIKDKFKFIKNKYNNNLVYTGKEKLNKITIFFIIILNIIVLNVLLTGISFQTSFLNNPETKYPYQCKNLFNKDKIIVNDLYTYNNYYGYYGYSRGASIVTQEIKNNELSLECSILQDKINFIRKEINFKELVDKERSLNAEINKSESNLNNFRQTYNTSLFENIANNTNTNNTNSYSYDNDFENKKNQYNSLILNLETQKTNLDKLKNNFDNNELIKNLKNFLIENKIKINKHYNDSVIYHNLTKNLIECLFTLPLLIISFLVTRNYLRQDKYIHYIISKNILVVISLPILFNIISLSLNLFQIIYNLLPKTFLNFIINTFYNLHLSFLLYYFLMFILIVLFGFLIIKIQKRSKTLEIKNKISFEIAIQNNNCFHCGQRVNYVFMNYCPHCQKQLKEKCKKCDKETITGLRYCYNCGDILNN